MVQAEWSASLVPALIASIDGNLPEMILRGLGRMHPVIVHFPIALLIMAGAAELITALFTRQRRSRVAVACLLAGAIAAAAAAWFGWLFAADEPPDPTMTDVLALHRWIGIAAAVVAGFGAILVLLDLASPRDWARNGYRAAVIAAAGVVGVTGHYGGAMVYGEDFVLSVFRGPPEGLVVAPPIVLAQEEARLEADADLETAAPADPAGVSGVDFETQVRPILAARCERCHGERRQRGDLRLDDMAGLLDEDPGGGIIRPGDASASELFRRITLPPDDPDHMPARGEPLTPEQTELIRAWIDAGAQLSDPATIAVAPVALDTTRAAPEPAKDAADDLVLQLSVGARRARDEALARLATRGGVALPIASNTDAVQVDLARAEPPLTDADLDLLSGLEPALAWLDLSNATITDDALVELQRFDQIRRLKLAHTPIGDEGVRHLANLPRLESLNLVGTRVTASGLEHLAPLAGLRRIYVWDTEVGAAALGAIRERLPRTEIIGGQTDVLQVATEEAAPATPLPVCCAEARAAGETCEHPCCVKAVAAGTICPTCPTTPAAGGT